MIAIFGAGRNGSTLLARLLDGSPGLWVYPIELNYLGAFEGRPKSGRPAKRDGAMFPRSKGEQDGIVGRLEAWAAEQIKELDETYVRRLAEPIQVNSDPLEVLRRKSVTSAPEYVEAFLESIRRAYDNRVGAAARGLVFKSIEVADIERYCELFPGLRCVHIVRHPFSNYASLKRTDMLHKGKPFWYQGGDVLRTFLEQRWIPHVRFILKAVERESGRHFLVRYEDVCKRPAEVVSGVCRWLNVAPPDDPTALTILGGREARELPASASKKGVPTPKDVVEDMEQAFGYEEVVTRREKGFIEFRARDLGRHLGYFPDEEPEPGQKARLLLDWIWPDEWELMNADSSLRLIKAVAARRLYIYGKLLT